MSIASWSRSSSESRTVQVFDPTMDPAWRVDLHGNLTSGSVWLAVSSVTCCSFKAHALTQLDLGLPCLRLPLCALLPFMAGHASVTALAVSSLLTDTTSGCHGW